MSEPRSTVMITTFLGTEYWFPDMTLGEMRDVVESMKRNLDANLILVNPSKASLTVPARIIAKITLHGHLLFHAPVP